MSKQSGCDQNAMQGKAFSSAHPYLPEYDIHEDEMHDAFPKLMDLRINPSNKDVRNEENNLRPENHENRLEIFEINYAFVNSTMYLLTLLCIC